ncbi:four-helix bundle copper-binding protein [Iningainema tapete]|uniref:Four-helix bundle copper-binding protein n=1 Tax=Iningainema tapete BLCC-T55 TaxID=2748662 RepID=A0A8J7C483_9CYAN|nr:four-helix bundle copper-binding protein [Iningainema tapete]MBD2771089.1 four-helix bundle copper-binding protein [Iningainema tapete BLCC-T55]
MTIPQVTWNQVSPEIQQCINNCLNCHSICLDTMTYCLQKGATHAQPSYIRLMLDCGEICQTSANFLLRASELSVRICAICAVVCDRCAQECEKMSDDVQMKACADVCRYCAESCRQIAL